MDRDFIKNQIVKKQVEYIKDTTDSYNMASNIYAKKFANLLMEEQRFVVASIIDSQSISTKQAILDGNNVWIKWLGKFKIKPFRRVIINLRRSVIKELGYQEWNRLTEQEKDVVSSIVEERKLDATRAYAKNKREVKPKGRNIKGKVIFLDKIRHRKS